MRQWLLVSLVVVLAGCGGQEESEAPGIRGPVVFRLWDRAARAAGLPPVVVHTDSVLQATAGFDDIDMVPVLIRRPMTDGVLWIHSQKGHFHSEGDALSGKRRAVTLQGPVHMTGLLRGLAVGGVAATAVVPQGSEVLELTDIRMVRGGMLMTAPRAELAKGELRVSGPIAWTPGAPALTAVLGAIR